MGISMKMGAALPLLALVLSGCSGAGHQSRDDQPQPKAAVLSIYDDSSASTAMISSATFADAAASRASDAVMDLKLGDTVRVVSFGTRTVNDNGVDVLRLKSGYNLRLPAVRTRVYAALHDLAIRNRATGGQAGTDMTYSLEQSGIVCNPRSRVVILSDGIVENEQVSVSKLLASGQPIHLPAPSSQFLAGCSIQMLGVGMAPGIGQNAQTLPNDQVQRLEAGLREYFKAAGATDVRFASVL